MGILRLPRGRRAPATRTLFVLGGGGNLGAIQVGMLEAVIDRGIVPDEMVGCSVGAINAAAVAADPTPEGVDHLREVWLEVQHEIVSPVGKLDAFRLWAHRGTALQSNDGLRKLLAEALPFHTFEEFRVPFHVVA